MKLKAKQLNDKGVENLIVAIYKTAAEDYREALHSKYKGDAMLIKDFLTSGAYGVNSALGESICKAIERGL